MTTTATIPYARELVAITDEHLAGWDQVPQDSTPLPTVFGPCPTCGDRCEVSLTDIVVTGGAPSAHEEAPVPETTRLIICNCPIDHEQPEGVAGGCGRYWLVTLTRRDDGSYAMTAERDLTLLAPTTALNDALTDQNTRVQSAAEKWLGAVTAIYGLFSLTGIATGKDALAGIAVGWRVLIAAVLLAGLILAGAALYQGYRAAYGWPTPADVGDNVKLRQWHKNVLGYAATAAAQLRRAVSCAVGSLAAVTVVMLLVWFLPRAT